MGHAPAHNHVFRCGGCGEEIEVHVIQRPETLSCDIECKLNCEPGEVEGSVVNLHPDFPIPSDQLHEDKAFPWLLDTRELSKRQREAMASSEPPNETPDGRRKLANEIQTLSERWSILRKAWSLHRNGRDELSVEQLQRFQFDESASERNLDEAIFHLCAVILHRANYPLFLDAAEFTRRTYQSHPEEFKRFKVAYRERWCNPHRDNYLDIFSEYFQNYSEFSQTLLFCQYKMPITDKVAASSTAFSRTKMFYGNAFEILTSHFVVLACVNNIHHGRAYDQFQNMDLGKYLTINKANRANPFTDTPPLSPFGECLDSTLRNASHHASIKLSSDARTINYRSGGSGAARSMRYVDYLSLCNQLLFRLAALCKLELAIAL